MNNIEFRKSKQEGCYFQVKCGIVKCESDTIDSTLITESNGSCVFLYEIKEGKKELVATGRTEGNLIYLPIEYNDIVNPNSDCGCVSIDDIQDAACEGI